MKTDESSGISFSWPEGKTGALTTSWDDNTVHDRRMVEILNRHGLKGTFFLNSGTLFRKKDHPEFGRHITADDVSSLYEGHEVASHTVDHKHLEELSKDEVCEQVLKDMELLKQCAGYNINGFSMPYGTYNDNVLETLKACGIVYARSTVAVNNTLLPQTFIPWHPTCHFWKVMPDNWEAFINSRKTDRLFYFWGHSYEFGDSDTWAEFDEFVKNAANHNDIWYAANMEIYRYLSAWQNLPTSANGGTIANNSSVTLWCRVNGKPVSLAPGASVSC